MADLAAAQQLGVVVDYEDVEGVAAALVRLAEQPELRQACGQRAREVARQFQWGLVTAPLKAYCRAPWRSEDHARRLHALRRERRSMRTPALILLQKAWRSLRTEGARSVAVRTLRYTRRRF
jgi:hypothetical protein